MTRVLRALGAVVAMLGLVAGVPFALSTAVGPPWPHRMPSLDEMATAIRAGDIGDSTIAKMLAVIVWIAWLRLTVSLVVDVGARLGGLQVPRVLGLGSSQRWAAALVGVALAAVASAPRPAVAAPIARAVTATATASAATADDAAVGRRGPSLPIAAAGVPHVVRPNESFWSIAEQSLGDGSRWEEIVELNSGRAVAAGTTFDGTANDLQPGWTLALPATPVVAGADLTGGGGEWALRWQDDRARDVASVNVGSPPDAVPADDVVSPVAPVVPAFPPPDTGSGLDLDTTSHQTLPPSPLAAEVVDPVVPAAPLAEARPDARGALSLPGGLGGAVMLSSGVMAMVYARRRRRLRSSHVSSRLAMPTHDAMRIESVLHAISDVERMARIEVALRAVAAVVSDAVPATRRIAVLGSIADRAGAIDVLFDAEVPAPPAPWQPVSAHCWRLSAEIDLGAIADDARRSGQPCPALAHVGVTQLDGGLSADVFVDLEAIGLLTIDAPPDVASDVLRAIAAGVAVSPLAETAHIVVAGLDHVAVDHPLVQHARSLDDAIDRAAGAVGSTAAALGPTSTTFALRARHRGGEAWEPAIVFAAGSVADATVDAEIVEITRHGGRGIAVVVDRPVAGATWSLGQHDERWVLAPLQIELAPVGARAAELAMVQTLLDEADGLLDEPDAVGPLTSPDDKTSVERRSVADEWMLMVRLLGPVEVVDRTGCAARFERSKALELVAWLVRHRERATRIGARTALWDADVRDATFANVVSDARGAMRRLVAPPPGEDWIARTMTERLPLHDRVIADVDVVQIAFERAVRRTDDASIAALRDALELVRAMPFADTTYHWPDAEGTASALTLLVTSAATLLGEHALLRGDTAGVFWATGRGLLALAGHEELLALRMRAHARHGDLAGVRHEWDSYQRALDADPWSAGDPSPKLSALRRELLGAAVLEQVTG